MTIGSPQARLQDVSQGWKTERTPRRPKSGRASSLPGGFGEEQLVSSWIEGAPP